MYFVILIIRQFEKYSAIFFPEFSIFKKKLDLFFSYSPTDGFVAKRKQNEILRTRESLAEQEFGYLVTL